MHMEITYTHAAGLDIHKKTVVACIFIPGPKGKPVKETRTFSTMTQDLLTLADWLTSKGITHVAMESTGEFWKPVYNLLEATFTVLVVNAQHIKTVPGRKTDVKDAEWLADLLRHGLLKGSFMLAQHLSHIDFLEQQIADFDAQIAAYIAAQTPPASDQPSSGDGALPGGE